MSALAPRPRALGLATAALVALLGIGVFLGVSGVVPAVVFRQPDQTKWLLSVLGPLALLGLLATRRPLWIAVAALIVVLPLGPVGAQLAGIHMPGVAVVFALAVVAAILAGPPAARPSPVGLGALLAGVLLLEPMLAGSGALSQLLWFAAALSVGWLVSTVARQPGGAEAVFTAVSVMAVIQALLAILEYAGRHQINFYSAAGSNVFGAGYFFSYGASFRPVGSFYDPISLGNALALALPLQMVLGARAQRARTALLHAAAIGITGAGLVLTLSRMSWVGAVAGCLVVLIALPRGTRSRTLGLLAPLTLGVLLLAVGAGGSTLHRRFASIFHPTASGVVTRAGDQARVQDWSAALAGFSAHPVAGVGFGTPALAVLAEHVPGTLDSSQAQSTYLQTLLSAGLLGAAGLLTLLGGELAALTRVLGSPDRALGAGLAGALVAMLVVWSTDVTVRYIPVACVMSVLFGTTAGLWQRSRAPA